MEKKKHTIIIRRECRSIANNKIVKFGDGKIGEINGIVKTMCQLYGGILVWTNSMSRRPLAT